ncbi:hypothetical protein PTTG_28095 [Puccinia triticina 1-1 BBBD Race 1]|uniref:Uncharacterized protein n=1 Tax=Puccinia triticina (isolate 1-1 / race 1 (BBBD)) TaxID=630390 RepID=A0A180GEP3_PUCT1|nr:hypothetical protein PTTG_28095 [Puccinia triticina 1-1 BBBD Race 1]
MVWHLSAGRYLSRYSSNSKTYQLRVTQETGADNWGSGREIFPPPEIQYTLELESSKGSGLVPTRPFLLVSSEGPPDPYMSATHSKLTYTGVVRLTTPTSDPAPTIVRPPVKKVPTAACPSQVGPRTCQQQPSSPFLKEKSLPEVPIKPVASGSTKSQVKKPVPTADPFKSTKPVSKLMYRDPSSSLNQIKIKKVISKSNQKPPVETKLATTSNQQPTSNPSVKKSVFENGSFDQKTKEKLKNYFVLQGRTVVLNYSTTSLLIPRSEDSQESYPPANSSNLDIITGATSLLCSKPKISPGPLEANMLKNLNPRIHPMLQGLKSQLDGRNLAEERDYNDMMILCLEAAKNLHSTIIYIISPEQFCSLYGEWDILAEWEDYQSGPKHRAYLRKRGQEPTPTPGPQPMEE